MTATAAATLILSSGAETVARTTWHLWMLITAWFVLVQVACALTLGAMVWHERRTGPLDLVVLDRVDDLDVPEWVNGDDRG